MAHTKGKWQVNKNIGKKSEIGVISDKAPCIIAIMGNSKEWPEEAAANALLIAAAPELLAACEEELKEIESLTDEERILFPECAARYGILAKAIAAAKGK